MTLPPAAPQPGPPALPGWDGDAVQAGLDPDLAGLDLDALADRDEPAELELYGLDPGDDAEADDWIAGVAVAGPGEAFAGGGPLKALTPGGTLAGLSEHVLGDGLAALSDDALVRLLHASRRQNNESLRDSVESGASQEES